MKYMPVIFECPRCEALHTTEGDFEKGEGKLIRAGTIPISQCEWCERFHRMVQTKIEGSE